MTLHVHVPYRRVREHLELLREHRLNLELYFDAGALDDLTPKDIDRLRDDLDYGPALSFHAPFMDLSPAAVDGKILAATRQRFSSVFDAAEILRPKAIVFHSGYEKWKYGLKTDLWLEGSLSTWRGLLDRAASIGTKIAIENIFEEDPENLRLLMEGLASAHAGICFDAGHFNLFSKSPLSDWLSALGLYIVELHLHDNDGTSDAHLPVGDGKFDFAALFSAMKGRSVHSLLDGNSLIHTIEAHTPERVMKSIEMLKGYLSEAL